ncbi:hypothetical protein NUU61_009854 [Penicillium alfredii]|uniref:Mediator of RNA polymerase II transcription subunit 13 n=1 Tax=Penicillium alfredii TaxID=1506179 RepID=A0A9W9EH24_9EURO|nr:uncharacterized protein NUU61_009854 [Penicillium alfredii]KAJ5081590.1 hypothetical protein NUU61_009854 [Penicillium alfredii]
MDFPGGAPTNIHLIDGFSNIYWRIYTEEPGIVNQSPESPANGYTILKHLGRLKDLEARLRNLNCLASCPRRLGLWVFSSTPEFESLNPLYLKEGDEGSSKIVVGATTLKVSALGNITASELVKNLTSESQTNGAQSSGPQRPQQGQASSRRSDGYNSSAAIYASFMSAITATLGLQLIRRHGALPLGSRTFFTAVEKPGYESPRIDNESVFSRPCLTTFNIQLSSSGTLTVSPQTVFQAGIARLYTPRNDITEALGVPPDTDLWLCPNGTIARLVTPNIHSSTVPSPNYEATSNVPEKQKQWKLDVLQWLAHFGLHVDLVDEEPWVEVEVWEPFFARLAGEAWRQSDASTSALPLKRMLWPARFCFRRLGPPNSAPIAQPSFPNDPLEFADQWSSVANTLDLNRDARNIPVAEEPRSKDLEMSSPKFDNTENIESLSRIAQYPDLQTTHLVYPTPPDGATAVGLNNPNLPDAFPEESDFGLLQASQSAAMNRPGTDLSPDLGRNPGLEVGSGRYDASDDEDLFGDMNEKEFGSKGITDDDFNFFDDPDLEGIDDDAGIDDPEKAPHDTLEADQPEAQVLSDGDPPKQDPSTFNDLEAEETHLQQSEARDSPFDELMDQAEPAQSTPDRTGQTISPPLSPVEIKKILFPEPGLDNREHPKDNRLHGHYHPVAFEKKLGDWEQKYGATGKFWFSTGGASGASDQASNPIPTIGLPHRGRHGATKTGPSPQADKAGSPSALTDKRFRSFSASSSDSDDSRNLVSEHVPVPVVIPSLKRKRVPSSSDILSAVSPDKSPLSPEAISGYKTENRAFLGNFLSNFSDWTLAGYFSAFQPQQLPVLLRREEQTQIAQLMVDQITQSSFEHSLDGQIGLFDLEGDFPALRTYLDDTSLLGDVVKLDLKKYTSLEEHKAAASTQSQVKDTRNGSISKVGAPHVRVRRGKDFLEALPPAVSFWETFGLEPAHGPKHISAYCIHPHAATKTAGAFLDRFGLIYQSCSFGSHSRGEKSMSFEQGMRLWDSESSRYGFMMQSLKGILEELGNDLFQYPPSTDNCVVYIINPFPQAAALADICAAFWRLFQQLVADAERRQARRVNELVLQIIPMDFVTSEDSMVVPSQAEYLNLALEVYSRCRPDDANFNPLLCAPPVLLSDPLPKAINFRLVPEKGSPLQDGRSLHIACSKSLTQRWISVAWSDGSGTLQKTMSYCLRYRNSGVARAVFEVRNEIWATTKHILDQFQARWKVLLVATESMDLDDVEAWASFAEQHNKIRPGSLELTILTTSTIPDLILGPPVSAMSMAVFNPQYSFTPVSTPNPSASIASPEQSGNAATPTSGGPAAYNALTPTDTSLETDSESVLADICDESWVAILSHRLNSSPHLTELRPALASGYLLRRKGATDSEGVFAMAVNLIYSQRPPASHDNILKETLEMYRDLASLARAKGMRSVQGNTLPWHVATALRAQELLSYVF